MKKNIFKNYGNLIISTLLLALAGMSCQKTATQPTINSGIIATSTDANARTASLATTSLKVTVSDADANNVPYNMQSDNGGAYINGTQNVQAIIDPNGNFIFNTQASTNPKSVISRYLKYNFSQSLSGNPTNENPLVDRTKPCNFAMIKSNLSGYPFTALQNLGINGNPISECVTLGGGFSSTTTNYRLSFHRGLEDVESSATAFVVVTRTKVKGTHGLDEWTITPIGCSPNLNSNVVALRNNDNPTNLYGYYYLPFSFTLTAQ